jgi:hypothetical protein
LPRRTFWFTPLASDFIHGVEARVTATKTEAAQSIRNLWEKLGTEWNSLKTRSAELMTKDIPSLNKKLWDLGVGAIWK